MLGAFLRPFFGIGRSKWKHRMNTKLMENNNSDYRAEAAMREGPLPIVSARAHYDRQFFFFLFWLCRFLSFLFSDDSRSSAMSFLSCETFISFHRHRWWRRRCHCTRRLINNTTARCQNERRKVRKNYGMKWLWQCYDSFAIFMMTFSGVCVLGRKRTLGNDRINHGWQYERKQITISPSHS